MGCGPLGRGPAFSKTLLTQQQLDLELPQILAGESDSELNGEHTFHSRLILNYNVVKIKARKGFQIIRMMKLYVTLTEIVLH